MFVCMIAMSETAPSSGISESIKKFVFLSRKDKTDKNEFDTLEILIPEQLQASYSSYTWPSAPVLAWYLYEHRNFLPEKHIVELGAGTALPSILAAKCGANVTITDSANLPKTLQHIHHCCQTNNLKPEQVKIVGITWGLFFNQLFNIGPIDLIISSDCFYEPAIFEDIIVTVAFLLERNPSSKFLCTYQERSADWSIEHLLRRWSLQCRHIDISNLGVDSGVPITELMQHHTIHLLEITRK